VSKKEADRTHASRPLAAVLRAPLSSLALLKHVCTHSSSRGEYRRRLAGRTSLSKGWLKL
jgi:hypothetical protein